ncbi:MAG: response regulator [Cytophagales bacterium]|nr:response regulator [Cytophagales bacterium]
MRRTILAISILWSSFHGFALDLPNGLSQKSDSLIRYIASNPSSQDVMAWLSGYLFNPEFDLMIRKKKEELSGNDEQSDYRICMRLGVLNLWSERGNESFKYFTKALYIAEKFENSEDLAEASFMVAHLIRFGVSDLSLNDHLQTVINIYQESLNPRHQAKAFLAQAYMEEDPEARVKLADQGLALINVEKAKTDSLEARVLTNLLNMKAHYVPAKEAFPMFLQAVELAEKYNDPYMAAMIYNNIGYYCFAVPGDKKTAITWFVKGLNKSVETGIKGFAKNATHNIHFCYRLLGQFEEALAFYTSFTVLGSQILSENYVTELAEIRVGHDLDKVELQNSLLAAEKNAQRAQLIGLVILSLLLMGVVGIIFYSRRKVNKSNQELRQLNSIKSRFFANISHELKTPLTLIKAPVETLLDHGDVHLNTKVRETLSTVKSNTAHLQSLIEEILDLTKLEAGKMQMHPVPTNLYENLEAWLYSFKDQALIKDIALTLDYKPDRNLSLMLDDKMFGKVIQNLLSNALKYTREGGRVDLEVEFSENNLMIRVTDTGVGISKLDIPLVFDRYFQSSQGKKAEGGTGIGLALVKELVDLHRGTIEVDSELMVGSTFRVTMPIEIAKDQPDIQVLPKPEENIKRVIKEMEETVGDYARKFDLDKPKLMLVEDHTQMRSFIRELLSPYFTVIEAENGRIASRKLTKNPVDLIISDIMMPEMDGLELLEEVKQRPALRFTSVIMLTARNDEEGKLNALTLGIDDYITKPFNHAELIARVRNILENRIKLIYDLNLLDPTVNITTNEEKVKEDFKTKFLLSDREADVLWLLSKRYSNVEISEALFVSVNTVKFHIRNIFSKLEIKNRSEIGAKIEEALT